MFEYYDYINDIGEPKILILHKYPNLQGLTSFQIWSQSTGDYCGSGYMTPQQLEDFCNHYKITVDNNHKE